MQHLLRLRFVASVLFVAFLTLGGAAFAQDGPPVRTEQVVYVLQPLDSVTVKANGQTEVLTIPNEGSVTLPNGQNLTLAGKSTAEARALIPQKCKGAQVSKITQFHGDRISILGEVQRPANLPIADTPMTLMDAIAAAGGYTTLANTGSITVLRQNADQVQIFKLDASAIGKGRHLEQNIFLQSGDIITVPRSFL